jgi:hypothetical protein
MATQVQHLFVEVFPIETVPDLRAYQIQMSDGSAPKFGSKLAYRLRQKLDGCWVWADGRMLTDTPPEPMKLLMAIDAIKEEQPKTYGKLSLLEEDYAWQPTPEIVARFVIRGPLNALGDTIVQALSSANARVGNAQVQRESLASAWVVNGEPAVSFSIVSHLIYATDLYTYALGVEKPNELVGLRVTDMTSTMQGEIIKVVGRVSDHRERLLKLTQRETMRQLLRAAPGDDLVVKVKSGQNEYDYVASALNVMIGMDNAQDFGVSPQQAAKTLRLKPAQRAQIIKQIADIGKRAQLIRNAYSTQNAPDLFTTSAPKIEIMLGNKRTRPYDVERLPQDLKANGPYWQCERFNEEPVRVAIINTLTEATGDFLEAMQRSIERDFGFQMDIVRERRVKVISRPNIESAVRALQKETFDVLLVFLENQSGDEGEDAVGDRLIKSQTVGRGIPCLVVHEATLHRPDAMPHLITGIYARAGNIPYLLSEPLTYADFVVGLDMFREQKKNGEILTCAARVYRKDGALLHSQIVSAPLAAGEEVPYDVLATLFPQKTFGKKRVLIHNNGRFRREFLNILKLWGEEIGATLHPVEITRRGVPRLYALANGKVDSPPFGATFRLSDQEALVILSVSPEDATPQPLHIRSEEPLAIEQAIHSVMAFTMLHYGAFKTPKLPVTIHNADYLRESFLRGITPEKLEGNLPYWL